MSEFDRDCNTYTQEGKILQLQYAAKAVQNSETIVGVKCLDGIVLGAEKLVFSKMLVEGTNRRIYNIQKNIGMVIAGKIPDGRHVMGYARTQSAKFTKEFDIPISGKALSDRLGLYLNAYTLYGSVRAFGCTQIIASYDKYDGFGLYMIEPTGLYYGYTACTAGKGRQIAKSEFQKRNFDKLTCRQALFHLAKILHLTHEQTKEKKYQIQLSWITQQTNFVHQVVPKQLRDEAQTRALKSIEEDQQN